MGAEEERCAEAARLQRIDEAFEKGDLSALRAAVDDASAIPNGQMPITVGSCLVYAPVAKAVLRRCAAPARQV